jgi:hypothetical protein
MTKALNGAHIANAIVAAIVGAFLWRLTLALGNNNPLGRVGSSEAVLFFFPILFAVLPLATRALAKSSLASFVWLIAVAPVVGALNVGLMILVAIATKSTPTPTLTGLVAGIWVLPLFYYLPQIFGELASARQGRFLTVSYSAQSRTEKVNAVLLVLGFSALLKLVLPIGRILMQIVVFSEQYQTLLKTISSDVFQYAVIFFDYAPVLIASSIFVHMTNLVQRLPHNIPGLETLLAGVIVSAIDISLGSDFRQQIVHLFFSATSGLLLLTGSARVLMAYVPSAQPIIPPDAAR